MDWAYISGLVRAHLSEVILALVFALLFDVMRVGSSIRSGIGWMRNKWSEHSVDRMRKRVAELERYRDRLIRHSNSESGLYLAVLASITGVLTIMNLGIVMLVLQGAGILHKNIFYAVAPFGFSALFALMGYNSAVSIWVPSYSALITKAQSNIDMLKAKLQVKERRG